MAKDHIEKTFWQHGSLIHCKFAPGSSVDFQNALMVPDVLFKQAELVKDSHATTAGVFELGQQQYFIKRCNVSGWCKSVRRIGRLSRAQRNWAVTEFLQKIGVRVPKIYMARWQKRAGLFPGNSYLVQEYLPHPMNVFHCFTQLWPLWSMDGSISRLADMIQLLHRHGVEHKDLKMTNFLALKNPEDGNFELGLFDFDGTVLHRHSCSVRVRTVELARAASSFFLTMRRWKIAPEIPAETIARQFWDTYCRQVPEMSGADYDFYIKRISKHIDHSDKRQG